MRIKVVAVGKLKDRGLREVVENYAKRLKRYGKFEEVELRDGSPDGIKKILKAVERSRIEGETLHLTYTLLLLARAHELLGSSTRASEAAREGLSLTTNLGQRYLEAERRRILNQVQDLLASGE